MICFKMVIISQSDLSQIRVGVKSLKKDLNPNPNPLKFFKSKSNPNPFCFKRI